MFGLSTLTKSHKTRKKLAYERNEKYAHHRDHVVQDCESDLHGRVRLGAWKAGHRFHDYVHRFYDDLCLRVRGLLNIGDHGEGCHDPCLERT